MGDRVRLGGDVLMTQYEPAASRVEMVAALDRMDALSRAFYWSAFEDAGCHGFIEFNGFMNEYIGVCRASMEVGIDFRSADVHSGTALLMTGYQAQYLAEKFNCIFGSTLRANPEARAVFARILLDDR